jgi:hypothetical protein
VLTGAAHLQFHSGSLKKEKSPGVFKSEELGEFQRGKNLYERRLDPPAFVGGVISIY